MPGMQSPGLRRVLSCAALATALVSLSAPALASPSLEVKSGETIVLDGTVLYSSVTVRGGGVLRVRPVALGIPGSGSLTLKAAKVTVEQDGVIDATGAGYAGVQAAAGGTPPCCPAAAGGAGLAGSQRSPGGGAGSGGKGAPGCLSGGQGLGGPGGEAFIVPENGNPGAAGGGAFFVNPPADFPNLGGRGGGALTIVAGLVELEGRILANGAAGVAFGGTGTGGGAGGFVSITAVSIAGSGRIEARGGAGSPAFSGSGGGGGGGVILITASSPLASDGMGGTLPAKDVRGGDTNPGDATCVDGEAGMVKVVEDSPACIDADGDGEGSTECGGQDCDDADATVRGGSKPGLEVCDGRDNDCNGKTDDDLVSDACPKGQACVSGACATQGSSGSGGAGGAGGGADAPPDYVTYSGACSMDSRRAAHQNGMLFFAAALAAFLLGLRSRKGR